MCTAASFKNNYFGRNLDYEFSYGEKITIVPRHYRYNFKYLGCNDNHYAIIGIAHIDDNYPLFYDGMNECGLAMAGLNFVGNAFYNDFDDEKNNVCQYELISYILATCKNVLEVIDKFKCINICNTMYKNYPNASLHWIIKDNSRCIVVEAMKDGLFIYDNKVGTLTNNPPFTYQLEALKKYCMLTNDEPTNNFSFDNPFYSRGMGAIGLPGDLSSQSRFVRVAFTSYFSKANDDEISNVNQFFHILESVYQQRGCCKVNDGYEITIYTSCMNLSEGIYYYKTYDNTQINAVGLNNVNLNTDNLYLYEMKKCEFKFQN